MLYNKNIRLYLEKLSKKELVDLIIFYHELCDLNNSQKSLTITKEKKDILVDYLVDYHNKYLEYIVSLFSKDDYDNLLKLLKKTSTLGIVNSFLEFLNNKRVLFNNEMPLETYKELKRLVKQNIIKRKINSNTKYYTIANGIIIAYGVIDADTFNIIINSDTYMKKIQLYYKKDYIIDNKKVYSNKLTNITKINKYLKNIEIKGFNQKDFLNLGNKKYHHHIKSYKKLIKVLKRKYIFKNYDIMFLDNYIIIPYLYSSLNEEKKANAELNEVIEKYFEFNNSELKSSIIKNISNIKNEFPLWELRGKSFKEVN